MSIIANANITNGNLYWTNVAWQENANANSANGKPTLDQYIHVIWKIVTKLFLNELL